MAAPHPPLPQPTRLPRSGVLLAASTRALQPDPHAGLPVTSPHHRKGETEPRSFRRGRGEGAVPPPRDTRGFQALGL